MDHHRPFSSPTLSLLCAPMRKNCDHAESNNKRNAIRFLGSGSRVMFFVMFGSFRSYLAVYCPRATFLNACGLLMSAWLTMVRKFELVVL